jgi:hypothetical protein
MWNKINVTYINHFQGKVNSIAFNYPDNPQEKKQKTKTQQRTKQVIYFYSQKISEGKLMNKKHTFHLFKSIV